MGACTSECPSCCVEDGGSGFAAEGQGPCARQGAGIFSTESPINVEDVELAKSARQDRDAFKKQKSVCISRIVLADNSGRCLEETYDVVRNPLASGTFGTVRVAHNIMTGAAVAVKTIKKGAINVDELHNEIEINSIIDHPNIAKLMDVYEDKCYAFLVFELCRGGEVMQALLARRSISEADAAILIRQGFRGLTYLHGRGIAHRDIKLENLMLEEKDQPFVKSTLKIIDFGLATRFAPRTPSRKPSIVSTAADADGFNISEPPMSDRSPEACDDGNEDISGAVGSMYYAAPEVLKGRPYREGCDVWSMGISLYIMLSGSPPFRGGTRTDVYRQIRGGQLNFGGRVWKGVSMDAKQVVWTLLQRDVSQRPSAEAVLAITWVKKPRAGEEQPLDRSAFMENLQSFGSEGHFKKAAVHLISHRLDARFLKELRSQFQKYDVDHDGSLSFQELLELCKQCGMSDVGTVEELFKTIDTDGSAVIDFTEFIAATMDQCHYAQEEQCWEAFCVFDKDRNGIISVDEFREVAALQDGPLKNIAPDELEAMLLQADANGDGTIDFQEFVQMLRQ